MRSGAHVWQVLDHAFKIDNAKLLDRFTTYGLNGQWNLVHRLFAAAGGDDDVFDRAIWRRLLGLGDRDARAEDGQGDGRC